MWSETLAPSCFKHVFHRFACFITSSTGHAPDSRAKRLRRTAEEAGADVGEGSAITFPVLWGGQVPVEVDRNAGRDAPPPFKSTFLYD